MAAIAGMRNCNRNSHTRSAGKQRRSADCHEGFVFFDKLTVTAALIASVTVQISGQRFSQFSGHRSRQSETDITITADKHTNLLRVESFTITIVCLCFVHSFELVHLWLCVLSLFSVWDVDRFAARAPQVEHMTHILH